MMTDAKVNSTGKILQANYGILDLTGECRVCLTESEVQWILSQIDYAGWTTRWRGSENIDRERILRFQAGLVSKLIEICRDCGEDCEMYLLRQNPSDPCQLEQSIDGGINWTLAFDYELCMFEQATNPPLVQIDPVTGKEQWSIDGGETWVDAPTPVDKTPLTTDVYADKSDPACWHTYNAVEVIRRMLMESGDELLIIITFIANILLVVITGGAALPVLLANIVSAILAAGLGQARADMTPERWQELREIIYCAHDTPTGWSLEAYGNIFNQIAAQFPPAATIGVQGMLSALTWVGLNNAGHLGIVTEGVSCVSIQCGDPDCGFTTNSTTNRNRWAAAVDRFEPDQFINGLGVDLVTSGAAMYFTGANTLGAFTEFENQCYITQVNLYTLGRGSSSRIGVAYKTFEDGVWNVVSVRTLPSWAAGVAEVFEINAPVVAIQVQSYASSGQNNFSTVVIGDPTP